MIIEGVRDGEKWDEKYGVGGKMLDFSGNLEQKQNLNSRRRN